ncbi:hypothetical protein [Streptomyces viridochromogenes]|nr:hypothetical protein [Streptomyces viridochromogenes]
MLRLDLGLHLSRTEQGAGKYLRCQGLSTVEGAEVLFADRPR